MALSEAEHLRYARQVHLPNFSLEGQERLKSSRVLIVGVGGLGCPIAQYLTGAGVGYVGLMDHDCVEISNLPRQLLYTESDVGRLKVDCAKEALQKLNPYLTVNVYPYAFEAHNSDTLNQYDLVIDGTDQIELRYLLNAFSKKHQKAYLFGGVSGWKGMAGLFYPEHGPCYQCLFPTKPPLEALPRCSDGGVLGVLPGIIGTLQASLAIQYLACEQTPSVGEIHHVDLQHNSFQKFHLKSNETCPICCGDYLQLELPITELSAKQLKLFLQQENAVQIVDVREPEELSKGKIINSLNIPLWQLPSHISRFSKDQPIVFYCQKGIRSKRAVEVFLENGFSDVAHLLGGWEAWTLFSL